MKRHWKITNNQPTQERSLLPWEVIREDVCKGVWREGGSGSVELKGSVPEETSFSAVAQRWFKGAEACGSRMSKN